MRIVYIIDTLSSKGGAERIISEKMHYMADQFNYDVSIITCFQFPDSMPNCYPLSNLVKQINLCIPSYLQYKCGYPERLWMKWKYYRQLRQRLEKTVNTIKPEIVIGVGYTLADVVCRLNCNAAKIIESHEARIYTKRANLLKDHSPLKNLYYKLSRRLYLCTIEKNADVVVTLTKEDATNWKKVKRVEIIPNFSVLPVSKQSDVDKKRVISVGRLAWQKGFDRLIDIWKIISISHPNWQLDIYGEGNQESSLRKSIKEANISNISIHPFTKDISNEYASSSICVLTSRFEGFCLVLLEAMQHGLPCISFDCPHGPKDLIDNERCGYIIENGNINLFADRLRFLMDHPEVRKQFGVAAINKSKSYHVDTIMKQWKSLFESLLIQ